MSSVLQIGLVFLLITACTSSPEVISSKEALGRETNALDSESREVSTYYISEFDSLQNILHDEVWKIHDDAMPHCTEMLGLRKRLKEDSARAEKNIPAADSISAAYNDMMDWMRSFHPKNFTEDTTGLTNYLVRNGEQIDTVRSRMFRSIRYAQGLLEDSSK